MPIPGRVKCRIPNPDRWAGDLLRRNPDGRPPRRGSEFCRNLDDFPLLPAARARSPSFSFTEPLLITPQSDTPVSNPYQFEPDATWPVRMPSTSERLERPRWGDPGRTGASGRSNGNAPRRRQSVQIASRT